MCWHEQKDATKCKACEAPNPNAVICPLRYYKHKPDIRVEKHTLAKAQPHANHTHRSQEQRKPAIRVRKSRPALLSERPVDNLRLTQNVTRTQILRAAGGGAAPLFSFGGGGSGDVQFTFGAGAGVAGACFVVTCVGKSFVACQLRRTVTAPCCRSVQLWQRKARGRCIDP